MGSFEVIGGICRYVCGCRKSSLVHSRQMQAVSISLSQPHMLQTAADHRTRAQLKKFAPLAPALRLLPKLVDMAADCKARQLYECFWPGRQLAAHSEPATSCVRLRQVKSEWRDERVCQQTNKAKRPQSLPCAACSQQARKF